LNSENKIPVGVGVGSSEVMVFVTKMQKQILKNQVFEKY
jgi:hypothetical protein